MSSKDQDSYTGWIHRDPSENERLNNQNRLLTRAVGYALHPTIANNIHDGAKVIDIGTGTGALLKDIAEVLQATCHFVGTDISDVQFPIPDQVPSNFHFSVLDCKKPPPAEHIGKYDVVLMRYLNLAISDSEWMDVAKNAHLMLKSEGYLQWIEPDFLRSTLLLHQDPSIPTSAHQTMYGRMREALKEHEYPATGLEGDIRAAGFIDIIHEVTSTDRLPEDRMGWTINTCKAVDASLPLIEKRKGSDGFSAQEVAELMREVYAEAESGAVYSRYDLHTFIARKA